MAFFRFLQMQSVAILSNCAGATVSSLVFVRCSTVLRRYFDISVPLRKYSSCLSSFKRQLELLIVSTTDGRNLMFVFSSDTLKRKWPSESVTSELDVLETLGTVPPSHCLHDALLCVTHPEHKHVSQSWRDSNCCEEKKWEIAIRGWRLLQQTAYCETRLFKISLMDCNSQ